MILSKTTEKRLSNWTGGIMRCRAYGSKVERLPMPSYQLFKTTESHKWLSKPFLMEKYLSGYQ